MRVLALHGVPLGPRTFERVAALADVPFAAPALRGLATAATRAHWRLDGFVDEVLPEVTPDTVLVGTDLGGVVAAMIACRTEVRAVVLSGTALGPYWAAVRATAAPLVWRYFYRRHGGRRFLAGGVGDADRAAFLAAMTPELAAIPDLPARMRALAREMTPPRDLARAVAARARVRLVWGRRDPWYPPPVARALARATGAEVTWLDAAHYAAWEAPAAFWAAVRAAG